MARDLRTLFTSNDASVTAAEAFTNRQAQWRALTDALTEHLAHVTAPGFDVQDLEAPRRNVITYFGVGGIGKTTLSRKIEASLADAADRPPQWAELSWPQGRLLAVRIDLARSAGLDFERIILTLRLAMTQLGHPMPAFDLALRRYWDHNHPGEPIEDYLRRTGLLGRFTTALALPEQLKSVLDEAAKSLEVPGAVVGLATRVTTALAKALREHRSKVRALAGCTRLADLLEAEPDLDMLSYAPHLLAFDLTQLPGRPVVPVILLDTFEDTGDRTHRDLERLLQRLVWLMPGAFFVITGRNRIPWADSGLEGQLDWTGPLAWPGLDQSAHPQRSGGRQVLIGDFSEQDCEGYLARRLSKDGRPLISEPIRETVTARSHGLPLHLDLAVSRFLEIRRSREPQPADFDQPFPALLARTVSDLTPDERHVLRSISLLSAFSIPLATAAAGLAHDAAAIRLAERPFVAEEPGTRWPLHLHQVVRDTIRTAEDLTDDRWSDADWTRAATRTFTALGDELATHPGDRSALIDCLRQALPLASEFDLPPTWLVDAAFAYVGDSVWEPLASASAGSNRPVSAADAVVELLTALARRQHENKARTVDRLEAVYASGHLPAPLADMALYYQAKAERDLGRTGPSRHHMRQVAQNNGRFAPRAQRGLAHLTRVRGDFPTAFEAARTLGWEGRRDRLLGEIWWPHGRTDRAVEAFRAARTEAEQHANIGEQAVAQTALAFSAAFGDPHTADDELDLAQRLLDRVDQRATRLIAGLAALLRDAGTDRDIEERAQVLRVQINDAGYATRHVSLQLILSFHHAVIHQIDQVEGDIFRLRELTAGGDYAYYVDLAHYMAGLPLPVDAASPARWLDGADQVRARWQGLIEDRRRRIG